MRTLPAAIIGGLVAGVATTALMTVARKSGVFGKTLDRDAVDWIDDVSGSRAVIGDAGTSVVEFANHLAASATFAAAWPTIRKSAPGLPAPLLAASYGTALYAINIGAIAPALGITEGEIEAGPRKAAERWTIHVVQTVVTALIADRLAATSGSRLCLEYQQRGCSRSAQASALVVKGGFGESDAPTDRDDASLRAT